MTATVDTLLCNQFSSEVKEIGVDEPTNMEQPDSLNVYTGPDSMVKYYDPDFQPPLPLVELPRKLNPFYEDGIRIYAKMMTALPANNVKSLPALKMLQSEHITSKTKTVVEYSSGSTIISLSVLARVLHNIQDVQAFLSNKTSETKLMLMRFFGLRITLFGGPSQPEPTDERGGIRRAAKMAKESETIFNPNQYENEDNPNAHVKWTGPQLLKQLPSINVLAGGIGTSGTMTGLGTYMKENKPSCHIIGVCTAPGDRVPGPRSYALLAPVKFRWREVIDTMEEVGSSESYRLSLLLSREGLICGPSSGFALEGLYCFLRKRKDAGTIKQLAGKDGKIHCVVICCDLPYQYLSDYFMKLGDDNFPPITNNNLANVDTYRYDEAWELDAETAFNKLYLENTDTPENSSSSDSEDSDVADLDSKTICLQSSVILLDLRSTSDFKSSWHMPGAVNLPLASNTAPPVSPFDDSNILRDQWKELNAIFDTESAPHAAALLAGLKNRFVCLVCATGDTARVASSVLRAKGLEAYSVAGGIPHVAKLFGRNI